MRLGLASRKTSPSPDPSSRFSSSASSRSPRSRQSAPLPTQAPTNSRAEVRFDGNLRRHAQQHAEALVADGDAALGVEHAQPVRHIVERRIEPAGQQAHVAVGHHGIEQNPTQAVRDEFQRDEERHENERENRSSTRPPTEKSAIVMGMPAQTIWAVTRRLLAKFLPEMPIM